MTTPPPADIEAITKRLAELHQFLLADIHMRGSFDSPKHATTVIDTMLLLSTQGAGVTAERAAGDKCAKCKGTGLEAIQGHPDQTFYCEVCNGSGKSPSIPQTLQAAHAHHANGSTRASNSGNASEGGIGVGDRPDCSRVARRKI